MNFVQTAHLYSNYIAIQRPVICEKQSLRLSRIFAENCVKHFSCHAKCNA